MLSEDVVSDRGIYTAAEGAYTHDCILQKALSFVGTPYLAASLEINSEEQLVVNLSEVDCMSLVENCLALCLSACEKDYISSESTALFASNLQRVRYRGGHIDGYLSRLHYTCDWIADNQSKGILRDISKDLGGVRWNKKVNFMSKHAHLYKSLKENPALVDSMRLIEEHINEREYYYIPKGNILAVQGQIEDGDIICFTTSIAGLDVSHLGIACWQGSDLGFIHASSKGMVKEDGDTLIDYCMRQKQCTGIMLARKYR
ncbi:xylanase [Bacteroidales bacterium]|nr:xylanase [Bacteroidales bacterium]